MHVSSEDISEWFEELLAGAKTREEAADWAYQLRRLEDARQLTFDSSADSARMISALEYLEGVDLKDGPESYLHDMTNIRVFFEKWRTTEGKPHRG